jgi:hypothetical protein
MTGTLTLNLSATSWASLNDVGPMTEGLDVPIGSGRTTAPRPRDDRSDAAPAPAEPAAARRAEGRSSLPPCSAFDRVA